jgi:6-pyruvoyltetrahydropterin/6-carboxytetrahydropterin synthase
MPKSYLTRVVEFVASHRIRRPEWSEERNAKHFGKAAADHGHSYQVRVTVKGQLEPREGGVVSLGALDELLKTEIHDRFEGRHINQDVAEFSDGGWLPTGESLAVYIWQRLAPRLPKGVALHVVRVQEGPHLYSEYFGEP